MNVAERSTCQHLAFKWHVAVIAVETWVRLDLAVACTPVILLLAQSSCLVEACLHVAKGWGQGQDAGVWALQNDFTPEEEEVVRRKSQWAFD